MLTAKQVLDEYFLDARCMLLEIGATLDRHDAACRREGAGARAADPRLEKVYQSLGILADPSAGPNRAEQLLNLFSDPVD
ncbi:MAG TPA: hypothetical protein VMY37_09035 [Thermoguttaceae bacterium]|nr:hypothetical protein [Thermoguttaceae bacterium]